MFVLVCQASQKCEHNVIIEAKVYTQTVFGFKNCLFKGEV